MKYREHFNKLLDHFSPAIPIETTIFELAKLIDCSERHTKTVLKSFHEQGVIQWETKRGRGKKPQLTILLTKEQFLLENAKRLVEIGDYHSAFEVAKSLGTYIGEFEQFLESNLGIVEEASSTTHLDILRYPFYETDLSMDPLSSISRHDSHMIEQIFERLVVYDKHQEELKPRIARNWETTNGIQWTFYLHKGVRFHHGRELSSHDVRYSITRLAADSIIRKQIKEIKTPSPYIIIFLLHQQNYLFPRYLSSLKSSIVPHELIGEEFRSFPVGAGPYRLTVHNENLIRLDVFKEYYRERPWLDRIEIIKSDKFLDSSHPLLLRAPDDSWEEVSEIEEGADFITLNSNRTFFQDIRIRQKLCNLLNPDEFCYGREEVATSFLTKRSRTERQAAVSVAREKFINTPTLKIAVQQIRKGVNHQREALILQKQLKRGGIKSTIDIVSVSDIGDPDRYSQYDIFVGGTALSGDKLLSVITAITSTQFMLYSFMNAEIKATINNFVDKIKTLQEESTRWRVYYKMEEYLKEQGILFFLNHRYHSIFKPKDSEYVNVELNHNGRVDYRRVWKRQKLDTYNNKEAGI